MCGIFGALYAKDPGVPAGFIGQVVEGLLRYSETRGNEAAGFVVNDGSGIEVVKQAGEVTQFLKNPLFRELVQKAEAAFARVNAGQKNADGRSSLLATMGHSRMVTNGAQSDNENNQPVIVPGAVGIHNGIIVNDAALWRKHPDLTRRYEVDTEVMLQLVRKHLDSGAAGAGDTGAALQATFGELFGAASTAIFFDDRRELALATNTGSLHTIRNERGTFLAFASERYILQELVETLGIERVVGKLVHRSIRAKTGLVIDLETLREREVQLPQAPTPRTPAWWELGNEQPTPPPVPELRSGPGLAGRTVSIIDRSHLRRDVRRCVKCILPDTYPFMRFDATGVCSYCRNWRTIQPKGKDALLKAVEPYRSKDGRPDVIVAFSGGRDSAFGLNYVKKELGMNPVAFTLDWGLVTDLARRNQARICGTLGVEHLLRSADIAAKRRYVRKNIEAWLKRPDVGMVTLFTAGDKEFYHYARQIRKETGIKLVIFCTGNMIEDTPYKTGLCGISEDDHGMTLTGLSFRNEMALLWYYFKNYVRNPAYFNESLWDTFKAYYYTFVQKDDFLYLFHYLPWREQEIVGTIRREFDWEVATDTQTTWRIGDGTAPFYNYIYQTIAGFGEDEVMLSNMVREGHLTREQAFERAKELNKPRFPSIREYGQIVGFNVEEALKIIHAAPKLY
jgi:asparagine synthetase B (glutamine-hydrolysing)